MSISTTNKFGFFDLLSQVWQTGAKVLTFADKVVENANNLADAGLAVTNSIKEEQEGLSKTAAILRKAQHAQLEAEALQDVEDAKSITFKDIKS